MGALRDQTVLNIREWAGGRKQKARITFYPGSGLIGYAWGSSNP